MGISPHYNYYTIILIHCLFKTRATNFIIIIIINKHYFSIIIHSPIIWNIPVVIIIIITNICIISFFFFLFFSNFISLTPAFERNNFDQKNDSSAYYLIYV